MDIKSLKIEVKNELKKAKDLKELDEVFRKYLGKKGEITRILRSLKNLPETKRKETGKLANQIKKEIEEIIKTKKYEIQKTRYKTQEEWIDITRPGKKIEAGHLNPLSLVKRKTEEIFQSMGFSIAEGPEIETEWYNFDALNVPKDHPARDLWDTFYLQNGLLLRTHTTPVDVRFMEKNNPPLRIIIPGRCFRHEATDASHEFNFFQVDGLMVGKDISVANFKAIIQEFFRRFFGKPIEIRLIPSFFPFVEPGFQVDMTCLNCGGKGCSACSHTGWLEMMGAGMVHPNVFKNSGLAPHHFSRKGFGQTNLTKSGGGWQGFAFGMGMDRLAMMKYKINDIRLFYSGDLRFLKQF
jgi:phenylalanyl-tRNA synthetase alpha chain